MPDAPQFLFDVGSPNAYLAHLASPAIEQRIGVKFEYVPILLGGIFKATNNRSPAETLAGIKNKPAFQALETERFVRRYGVRPYVWNPHFPVNTLNLMRAAVAAQDASAFFLDELGRVVIARRGTLIVARGETITVTGPGGSDGQPRPIDEIAAVLPNGHGERLVSNPGARNVIRTLANGRFVSVFASGQITRMAENWLGDVALLDRATKSVSVVDADGKAVFKVATKGTGWEFAEPTDVAFDQLGHLYILDRGRSAIFVFGNKGALVTAVVVPERSPGALSRGEALALDAAGRPHVYDERARRIQVYQ